MVFAHVYFTPLQSLHPCPAFGSDIIGILIALLSAVQAARETARRYSFINNLKQISLAAIHFESIARRLPSNAVVDLSVNTTGNNGS